MPLGAFDNRPFAVLRTYGREVVLFQAFAGVERIHYLGGLIFTYGNSG